MYPVHHRYDLVEVVWTRKTSMIIWHPVTCNYHLCDVFRVILILVVVHGIDTYPSKIIETV